VVGIELPSLGCATTWPFIFFYQKGMLKGFCLLRGRFWGLRCGFLELDLRVFLFLFLFIIIIIELGPFQAHFLILNELTVTSDVFIFG
jgi:hypothetical protein